MFNKLQGFGEDFGVLGMSLRGYVATATAAGTGRSPVPVSPAAVWQRWAARGGGGQHGAGLVLSRTGGEGQLLVWLSHRYQNLGSKGEVAVPRPSSLLRSQAALGDEISSGCSLLPNIFSTCNLLYFN